MSHNEWSGEFVNVKKGWVGLGQWREFVILSFEIETTYTVKTKYNK